MATGMHQGAGRRLERSCTGDPDAGDWLRSAPAARGLERTEAFFAGRAFGPHRHDRYAVGVTLRGVQAFGYRGAARHCLPGQVFVLHPDERHDGRAGTGAGFRYRILYVDPAEIAEALEHRPLPFVGEAVGRHPGIAAAVGAAFAEPALALDDLLRDRILLALADALAAADPSARPAARVTIDRAAVRRARDCLDACLPSGIGAAELAAVAGLDRFVLARQFRACLGTSPHRYLVMRRLDLVRRLVRDGLPLAAAALEAGFADQSHMTRHFRRAYGLPPGRWTALSLPGR
ncbi:MAG: AraC family transcriptional regulator [Sneathiellaceae bacterium]